VKKNLIISDVVKLVDVPTITTKQSEFIANAMRRIADGCNKELYDIKELEGYTGVYRLKPSQEMRNICDMEVRCVFTEDGDTIEIVVARKRNTVYRVAKERLGNYQRLQDRWLSKDNG